jgi:hypothetical protein
MLDLQTNLQLGNLAQPKFPSPIDLKIMFQNDSA